MAKDPTKRGKHTTSIDAAEELLKWMRKKNYEFSLGEITQIRGRRASERIIKINPMSSGQTRLQVIGKATRQVLMVFSGEGFITELKENKDLQKSYVIRE